MLLAEFVFPVNQFLPRPSLIYASFNELAGQHDILNRLLFSVSLIYFSLLISFITLKIFSPYIKKSYDNSGVIASVIQSFRCYIPVFLLGFLFIMWSPANLLNEYFYLIIAAILITGSKSLKYFKYFKNEYIDAGLTLSSNGHEIKAAIIRGSVVPGLVSAVSRGHVTLWAALIIYEFAHPIHPGIGGLIAITMAKWNAAYFFAAGGILLIVIYTGGYLLNALSENYFPAEIDYE